MSSSRRRHRIAIGGIAFEGNSLSPRRSDRSQFEQKYLKAGAGIIADLTGTRTEYGGALEVLQLRQADVVPLLATHGGAGGRVTSECWSELKGELLSRLRDAMPVDGVYLALHGAMLCVGSDDPEAEILEEVRAIVGERPIAASYDLHAHLTPRMLKAADITVAYQLYPHDDTFETGQRTVGLLLRTLDGEINPVVSMCTVPAIIPSQKQRTKGATPMAALYRRARSYEAETGALAVSYIATQPWMDVPGLGFSTVAVTNGDAELADQIATGMGRKFWESRHDFDVDIVAVDDAVRRGMAIEAGPVILVDAADCVGGGAVGDSVEALKRVLALAPKASVTTLIVDAETAQQAQAAGIGAEIDIALGNKLDRSYGTPLRARATVEGLSDGRFRFSGGVFGNTEAQMGPAALLRIGAGRIVVASFPSYEYAAEQLRALGLDPREFKFVIVKNPMNYQQAFEGAAAFFILNSPGPTTPDLKSIAIPRAGRPLFPFDDNFDVDFTPIRNKRG